MLVPPQWRKLLDHVMAVPEKIYEGWNTSEGWDNNNFYGKEFGENRVPWCVIFDWCMYHETGLDSIVPRADNVVVFSNWARQHGQWSEFPSAGAWVNFGNGHTEICVGFDETYVYTKGGNSAKAGATDNGQGNGVWSHKEYRRAERVVGYFAPRFSDGVCPPTADPEDPRGGAAVASYHWTGPAVTPAPKAKPVVSVAHINAARKKDIPAATGHTTYKTEVLVVERALHSEGLLSSTWVDGSFGTKTQAAYDAFRRKMNYRGGDATGSVGLASLRKLAARHGFTAKA